MIGSLPSALVAHLWQSTLVIGIVWLATLALRGNRPRVRYWLWFAASVKFLVPFSWLVALGTQFEWRSAPPITTPVATFVMEEVLASTRLATTTASALPAGQSVESTLSILAAVVWAAGFLVVLFWWWRQWRPVGIALRQARPVQVGAAYDVGHITVRSSPSTLEPGVVGIWHPILLLPEGLIDRLPSSQLNALLAHERCHIRCRDNLAAAVHMLVEAVFWFHPLVWWIERRMIDERERACDEAVLRAGIDPDEYVAGILAVCRFTLRAPLACVTGVTGSDLRARVESIARNELGARMTFMRRIAVGLFALTVIGIPIAAGVSPAATPLIALGQEPRTPVFFEVAVVRRNTSGQLAAQWDDAPGGRFVATNATLRMLIQEAYRIGDNQIIDAPAWIRNERFDVNAKLAREAPIVRGAPGERQFALQSLLSERFKLVVRRETREFPMYALVMAREDRKPGPGLKARSYDCSPEPAPARTAAAEAGKPPGICGTRVNTGRIRFGGSLSAFARAIAPDGRSVVDRTGLSGSWEFDLAYTPDPQLPRPGQPEPPPFDPNGPSLVTALQEQLGLKLESIRGPMEVLVVDRVERLVEDAAPVGQQPTSPGL